MACVCIFEIQSQLWDFSTFGKTQQSTCGISTIHGFILIFFHTSSLRFNTGNLVHQLPSAREGFTILFAKPYRGLDQGNSWLMIFFSKELKARLDGLFQNL